MPVRVEIPRQEGNARFSSLSVNLVENPAATNVVVTDNQGNFFTNSSVEITGSITNAISASYAYTASSAISSSFASTAQTLLGSVVSASYAYTASSAVNSFYAITASYAMNGGGGGSSPTSYIATGSITASVNTVQSAFSVVSESVTLMYLTNTGSFGNGQNTEAIGEYSHAEGYGSVASGAYSHAEGNSTTASGSFSHSEGFITFSTGNGSHAEGTYTTAIGDFSHAEGQNTKTGLNGAFEAISIVNGLVTLSSSYGDVTSEFAAGNYMLVYDQPFDWNFGIDVFEISSVTFDSTYTKIQLNNNIDTSTAYVGDVNLNFDNWTGNKTIPGNYTHAEGNQTFATGENSHAEGNFTLAATYNSHAEGGGTKALGWYSHAEGNATIAFGVHSHAEGAETTAVGQSSHAEGQYSNAYGNFSHAEGLNTLASGSYSHAEGTYTIASGSYSHAEGGQNSAIGEYSHVEGRYNFALAPGSHAEGYYTIASGSYSHTEGMYTKTSGSYSHAEGYYTFASGDLSHAEGDNTIASAPASHAEGHITIASGYYSHAEGNQTHADGFGSHAEGGDTIASGYYSHAEGLLTSASSDYSHAEGIYTVASGQGSHAEGHYTIAIGNSSHTEGLYTTASANYQHVQGKYNVTSSDEGAFIVGNGTDNLNRSNLIFAAGNSVQITGSLNISGSIFATAGITGSMVGTASWAINALTASSADNFTVRGTLTAQTIVAQTVSSSVVYSSGSNTFGNSVSNVQQMTGSLRVSGSGDHWVVGGNVGIGAAPGSYKLDISGSGRFTETVTVQSGTVGTSTDVVLTVNNNKAIRGGATTGGTLYIDGSQDLTGTISVRSTTVSMTGAVSGGSFSTSGNVNAGTAAGGTGFQVNSVQVLNVKSTNDVLRFNDNSTFVNVGMYGNAYQISNSTIPISMTFNSSSLLELNSTTKGFLPPRMTASQRTAISSPAVGLMVYQTDGTEGVYVYTSTGWKSLAMV